LICSFVVDLGRRKLYQNNTGTINSLQMSDFFDESGTHSARLDWNKCHNTSLEFVVGLV